MLNVQTNAPTTRSRPNNFLIIVLTSSSTQPNPLASYYGELHDEDCRAASFVAACKELLRNRVFLNDEVLRLEVRGRQVIHDLMRLFWEGAQSYLEDRKTHTKTYGGKLYLLISENYRELFEQRLAAGEDKTYCAVQLVTDYISGMTDGFACKLHQDLMNG
jgi:dGTPase